ncbi:BlaI/MecI/CopY family transcriptional regulator [Candidatus Peregrinibacteria bacterium]|nr:MAG: BlaI/MecI/CopY family transcriptional regulator [Candidatus Peregrinibacteria bacterium]
MIISQELTNLGLTSEESKVYLAVLELGSAFVSSVARRAKVNRSTCYHTLDNLVKKGLVSSHQKGKVLHFTAEDPKRFMQMAEEKMDRTKNLIPQLVSMMNTHAFKPKIKFYEGVEGIKAIFEDVLTTKDEVLGYTNIKYVTELFPNYFKQYCHKKVHNGIKTRYITPSTEEGVDIIDDFYPKKYDPNLLEILMVNRHEFNFENEIAIYGNKVAIMSLNADELIGLLVESSTVAHSMKSIFDLAWLGATAFVAK